MLKLLRFRSYDFPDLKNQMIPASKPFEDAGLVMDFPRDAQKEFDLVLGIVNESGGSVENFHYDDILINPTNKETPSTLYEHLHNRDTMFPTLCSYWEKDGAITNVCAVRDHYELLALRNSLEESARAMGKELGR